VTNKIGLKKIWKNTQLGTHVEGVCNWNPKLLIGYAVVCQEISLHPLNTPSRTHHPDNAMSKEYETVIQRFPLGSSHP